MQRVKTLPAASGPDFKARSIDTSGPIEVEAEYPIACGWRLVATHSPFGAGSYRGTPLAQNAMQPESKRPHHMGCVPPDQD